MAINPTRKTVETPRISGRCSHHAAVLSWDAPYLFRFGVAAPYHDDGLLVAAKSVSVYFAAGLAF